MSDYAEILKENCPWRVKLVNDPYPDEPYDDGQSPILRLDYCYGSWRATHVMDTGRPTDDDARIEEAAIRWGSDLWTKYLRAFHGATVVREWSSQDYTYITYDTARWREYIGYPPGSELPETYAASVNLNEYRAWCEGEVYGYVIEKAVRFVTDDEDVPEEDRNSDQWYTVDSCFGFYGAEYAQEAALEAFEHEMSQ